MTVAKLVDVSRTVETTAASAQKVDHSASGFNPPKKVFFFFFFLLGVLVPLFGLGSSGSATSAGGVVLGRSVGFDVQSRGLHNFRT